MRHHNCGFPIMYISVFYDGFSDGDLCFHDSCGRALRPWRGGESQGRELLPYRVTQKHLLPISICLWHSQDSVLSDPEWHNISLVYSCPISSFFQMFVSFKVAVTGKIKYFKDFNKIHSSQKWCISFFFFCKWMEIVTLFLISYRAHPVI